MLRNEICTNWSKLMFYISCSFCIISFPFEMVILFCVRSFYNFVFISNMHIKLSRVIIQMKTIITRKEWLTRLVKSRYTFQSKDSHTRRCYCSIASHTKKLRSNRQEFGDSPWIYIYNHFYELTYVKNLSLLA